MIDRQYRCPVCGAPIEGDKCEYCGCVIYDFANISTDEPRYIRLKIRNPINGQLFILQMKAIAVNPEVTISQDEYYATDRCGLAVSRVTTNKNCRVSLELQAVQEDNVLFTLIPCDKPYRESWRDDIENV